MSKFSELLKEFAPRGIEHFPLSEVAEFKRGSSITKAQTEPGDVPVVAGGRNSAYFHSTSNRSRESIVVAGSGAYAGFVTFWDKPIFVSDAFTVHPFEERLLAKYVYYWLASRQQEIHETKTGGGVPHVYISNVASLVIPVPPLAVQHEIVRVLDSFTELEAELEAEPKPEAQPKPEA